VVLEIMTMKTFNIWKYNSSHNGPTGGWEFKATIRATDEKMALEIGKMRFGLTGEYSAFEGF
jgi:hypothetical protein